MKSSPLKIPPLWKTALPLVLVILLVFAGLIALLHFRLKHQMNREIQQRDAIAIQALTQLELEQTLNELGVLELDPSLTEFVRWEALVATADYSGVLGIQLYDSAGFLLASIPESLPEGALQPATLKRAQAGNFTTHYRDSNIPKSVQPAGLSTSLLEVVIPLRLENDPQLLGIARYWIDGTTLSHAFSQLDRRLLYQSLLAFCGGAAIILLVSGYGFWRLFQTQNQLTERSQSLIEANADLSLAIKTNVVGTLASHLLHELKNLLSGLAMYLDSIRSSATKTIDPEDIQMARDSLKEMDQRIQEIALMLRENKEELSYEVTLEEFRELFLSRLEPYAEEKEVRLLAYPAPEGSINSHQANLMLLILTNLARNAIEVTPKSLSVSVEMQVDEKTLHLQISDRGAGVPEAIQSQLFNPGVSRKTGGSGLGLAISKQIALHLNANLRLIKTGEDGSIFGLSVPLSTIPDPLLNSINN